MIKISSKTSTNLSIALSIVFFVALIFGAVIMPYFVDMLVGTPEEIAVRPFFLAEGETVVLVIAYMVLAIAMLADVLLFLLLRRVQKELVFTPESVALIRGISWCAILIGGLFLVLTYYFKLALVVAVAAVFLGLCLRVVKNVIEKATEIKCENDLTV
ncbi:MAG: DUF2975 domain-containing protein [Ruminococcaceae bacterium]|nr:DUF2975 domain-containing protein [Oscillospiraceae bacterium]